MKFKSYSIVALVVLATFIVTMMATAVHTKHATNKQRKRRRCRKFETYSIDGSGNNLKRKEWGRTNKSLKRMFGYHYPTPGDKVGATNWNTFDNRPSCCSFEKEMLKTKDDFDIPSAQGLSILTMSFGQFASAHDIAHSPPSFQGGGPDRSGLDPTKETCFTGFFSRSVNKIQNVGGEEERHTLNTVTSFLDLHIVYGEDKEKAKLLRQHKNGLLRESVYRTGLYNNQNHKKQRYGNSAHKMNENYPPSNCPMKHVATLDFTGIMGKQLFCLGDDRGNQNRHLVVLQILFFREHNRLARQLKRKHPKWSDEMLYQKARVINIAQYQNIVFYEYLKAMLGEKQFRKFKLHRYKGYNKKIEPQVYVEFSQAVNRIAHSQIKSNLLRLGPKGQLMFNERLRSSFFIPSNVQSYDLAQYIYGMTKDTCQEIGFQVAQDVGEDIPSPFPSFHLTAIDCIRGRELGLIDYNGARKKLNLKPITSLNDITSSNFKRGILTKTYGGDPSLSNIDLYTGLLAEDHVEDGSALGEVGSKIFAKQYEQLRAGDRFWFENPKYKALTKRDKRLAKRVKLSDIILRNTNVKCIQDDVFHTPKFSKMNCQKKVPNY